MENMFNAVMDPQAALPKGHSHLCGRFRVSRAAGWLALVISAALTVYGVQGTNDSFAASVPECTEEQLVALEPSVECITQMFHPQGAGRCIPGCCCERALVENGLIRTFAAEGHCAFAVRQTKIINILWCVVVPYTVSSTAPSTDGSGTLCSRKVEGNCSKVYGKGCRFDYRRFGEPTEADKKKDEEEARAKAEASKRNATEAVDSKKPGPPLRRSRITRIAIFSFLTLSFALVLTVIGVYIVWPALRKRVTDQNDGAMDDASASSEGNRVMGEADPGIMTFNVERLAADNTAKAAIGTTTEAVSPVTNR